MLGLGSGELSTATYTARILIWMQILIFGKIW